MRHVPKALVLFSACVSILSCGRPTNDTLLKTHLGSLDPSKTDRLEIDFARINSSKDSTTWFYIEASAPTISDVLRSEGFTPGVASEDRLLTRIAISAKMPKPPNKDDCIFYNSSPKTRSVLYNAITTIAKDRVWIVAQRY